MLALRIRLVDEFGAGIVPAALLSRIVVNEGADLFLDKTALETSGNEIDLTLAQPAHVAPGGASGQITLSLSLDISASTTVPNFRLVIPDSVSFTADDATSGAPVVVRLQSLSYPVRSGLARIGAEAVQLDVTPRPDSTRSVGRGQTAVSWTRLDLVNVDGSGLAADIRVDGFEVSLVDSNGSVVADPSRVLSRIRVRGPVQTHLDRAVSGAEGASMRLSLSPPVSAPANTPITIDIEGDIAAMSDLGRFHLRFADTTLFEARDANTRSRVVVLYASDPLEGAARIVQSRTDSIAVRRLSGMPPSATVGQTDVPVMGVRLLHPGPVDAGPVRVAALTIQTRNQQNAPVAPGTFVDRLAVYLSGQLVGEINNPPGTGGSMTVSLTGVTVPSADSLELDLRFDVEPTAPQSFLQMQIAASGIAAFDANLGTGVNPVPATGTEFPLGTGLTQIQPPARLLRAGFESRMPAALVADGAAVPVGLLTLTNTASAEAGDILLDHLTLIASDRSFAPVAIGQGVERLEAWVGGTLWATSGVLAADDTDALLTAIDTLRVMPGTPETVELRLFTRVGAEIPSLRIGCDEPGIGVIQPSSALLSVAVQPVAGQAFPFWTESGRSGEASLRDSYSNFPNPFAAGREQTTFVFYLEDAARVTLRIWTGRGERVRTLADAADYAQGLHQSLTWDGRNGAGEAVTNGTYVAEIIVRTADGKQERQMRKVAVVR
jgi:hypothetical protein